jgi:hypothetical protein
MDKPRRWSTVKKLLGLPSTIASTLFVWSGLNFSGVRAFWVVPVWFVVIIAYDYLYESLVTHGRGPLAKSQTLGIVCVLLFQVAFWWGLFYVAKHWRNHAGA